MKKINKVMACMDFSDYSKATVEYALALTKGMQAEILLFNVINGRDVEAMKTVRHYFPGGFSIDNHIESLRTERRRNLKELVERLCPSEKSRIATLIGKGIPFEEILQTIESAKIDLVVMGNKGRSNLAGTLFGSNAEKVFRHSSVPVLSVRNRHRFSREPFGSHRQTTEQAMTKVNRIVAAIDFSIYSPQVLEYASQLAASTSAELLVVNIINKRLVESIKKAFNEEHPDTFSAEKFLNDETAKRTLNLADLINERVAKDVRTRIIIRDGVPFEEILKVVDNEGADLLVLNSKGRTNLAEYLFGTTAEKAFRHCSVPVLSINLRK